MDYPIFEGAPDVAQAVMPHILQAGSARPQSLEAPGPVAGPLIARATATPEITASSAYASGQGDRLRSTRGGACSRRSNATRPQRLDVSIVKQRRSNAYFGR